MYSFYVPAVVSSPTLPPLPTQIAYKTKVHIMSSHVNILNVNMDRSGSLIIPVS